MTGEIINRVEQSGIISLDLEDFYASGERVVYDIANDLFQGMILREKDFREHIKTNDWSVYEGKNVAIQCSEDAVIPTWAYMLLSARLEPVANRVVFGDLLALEQALYQETIANLNPDDYKDKRVVVKGCGDLDIPTFAYTEIARFLKPLVKSLMFGEPCSTVPIYKKKVVR